MPTIPARKHLGTLERREKVGYELGLGLLIRSGLWSGLSEATKAIAPVLLEFAEKQQPEDGTLRVRISYRAITRFSGIASPNAIRKALVELNETGFLKLPNRSPLAALERGTASYQITPNSNVLWELAQAVARQRQQEIETEIELRLRMRNERILNVK